MDLPFLTLGARPDVRADFSAGALNRWNATLTASAAEDEATISVLDPIGADLWGEGVTAKRIEAALRRIGSRPVTVNVNSPGGDVFEGAAIYNLLRQHAADRGPVTVRILGLAASAASVIAMAGDEILMGRAAFLMIHNAWVIAAGNRNDFAEVAEWLEPFDMAMRDVYHARSGQPAAEITAMMDREAWITASKALELGFADGMLDGSEISAGDVADSASASALRAEKKFDLIAARAGIGRKDARALLRDMKGGRLDALETDTPEAVDLEAGIAEILAKMKP